MSSRKILLILFLIPTVISFLRLLRIMVLSTTAPLNPPPFPLPYPPAQALPLGCSRSRSCMTSARLAPDVWSTDSTSNPRRNGVSRKTAARVIFNQKELRLMSSVISLRAPCNLLFFGLSPQLLKLSAALNPRGRSVFLEDGVHNLEDAVRQAKSQSVQVYRIVYSDTSGRAYDLLRRARANPACAPPQAMADDFRSSACLLALPSLPEEVYRRRWDVIVVDGPSGDWAEAPGRMGVIYSVGVMARTGEKAVDVLVHDVDRTVERWYSWEYLCHENLVSSKGRLWHFRIVPPGNSTALSFCPVTKNDII